MPAETEIPQPAFPLQAYGVELSWSGEEGAMAARGHVPDLRLAAAVNRMNRTVLGVKSAMEGHRAPLREFLGCVRRVWALPVPVDDDGFDWQVRTEGVTADTPGAVPITFWDPT